MKILCVVATALGLGCGAAGLCGCGRQSAVVTPAAATPNPSPPAAPSEQPAGEAGALRVARAKPQEAGPAKQDQPAAVPAGPDGDRGTRLVADLLRPSEQPFLAGGRHGKGPRARKGAASLEEPSLPLPALAPAAPRLPKPSAGPGPRPGAVPEEGPLSTSRGDPASPRRVALPADGPVRLPSVDVNQPAPLPLLATPQPDRAPLTDPAPEVSAAAALAEAVPVRAAPAPFVRLTLPDPFEHAQSVRLRSPLEEDPLPPIAVPRTPAR